MPIRLRVSDKGDFGKTFEYLNKLKNKQFLKNLDKYGQMGVEALRNATPIRTGKTANSWGYQIKASGSSVSINWTNSNLNKGVNIALLIQYGHGTGTGGYVEGIDYINPSLKPIFDEIEQGVWEEVKNL